MNGGERIDARSPGFIGWFALFGAPAAWFAQELLGWWLAEAHCANPAASAALRPPSLARAVQLGIGAVGLVIALAALAVALRAWRRRHGAPLHRIQAHDRREFITACSVLVSVVFVLAIGWAELAAALLPVCEAMR